MADEPLSEDQEAPESSEGEQPETLAEEPAAQMPEEEAPAEAAETADVVEEVLSSEPVAPASRVRPVPWWPFIVLLVLWLALAGGAVALLRDAAVAGEARWTREYDLVITMGVVLTGLGPLMSLGVWLIARIRAEVGARAGLLVSALLRGATVTTLGVALWVGALVVLDLLSNGRLVF